MARPVNSEGEPIQTVAAVPFDSAGNDLSNTAQVWKSYNSTSLPADGSAAVIWDPASGKSIAITSYEISSYGTTAFRMQLYAGAHSNTTYTAGTDQPIFVGSFIPSATVAPGAVQSFPTPIVCPADYEIMVQATAAGSVDIVLYGYEF